MWPLPWCYLRRGFCYSNLLFLQRWKNIYNNFGLRIAWCHFFGHTNYFEHEIASWKGPCFWGSDCSRSGGIFVINQPKYNNISMILWMCTHWSQDGSYGMGIQALAVEIESILGGGKKSVFHCCLIVCLFRFSYHMWSSTSRNSNISSITISSISISSSTCNWNEVDSFKNTKKKGCFSQSFDCYLWLHFWPLCSSNINIAPEAVEWKISWGSTSSIGNSNKIYCVERTEQRTPSSILSRPICRSFFRRKFLRDFFGLACVLFPLIFWNHKKLFRWLITHYSQRPLGLYFKGSSAS